MNHRLTLPFRLRHGRRLVDLRFRPGLQLKLPGALLGITLIFGLLFLAHTHQAYGRLFTTGFDEPWLHALALDIRPDYVVVSGVLGLAYAISILGACLIATHRLLGPVLVLQRHLQGLKEGDYTSRIRLRAGHPLADLAEQLNELGETLQRGVDAAESAPHQNAAPKRTPAQERVNGAVDELVKSYSSPRWDEERLDPKLAPVPG